MKYVVAAVLAILTAYMVGQCQGRAANHQPAVDSFRVAVRYSDSVEQEYTAKIIQANRRAEAASYLADSLRQQAIHLRAHIPRSSRTSDAVAGNSQIAAPKSGLTDDSTGLAAAYDSLAQAYDLMVRVDSLNQLQLAQKDSIIAAQQVQIAALQRVRSTAIRAVESQQCKILGLVKCPSRTTVGLVAAGAGFIGGYALGRH